MRASATSVLVGYDEAVAEWVRQQLASRGKEIDWGPYRAIGVARGGALIAGVVYSQFRWPTIEASIASISPDWCSRRNLAAIFDYPFRQLGCRRLGAVTEFTNQPARAFLCHVGFREEGILHQALPPRAANPTGDAVVYGMTPAECRWLPASRQGNRHEQRECGATGSG